MANERFEVFSPLLFFWLGSLDYEQRPNYRGLIGENYVLLLPYLSQFVAHLTDCAHLDVSHGAHPP